MVAGVAGEVEDEGDQLDELLVALEGYNQPEVLTAKLSQ